MFSNYLKKFINFSQIEYVYYDSIIDNKTIINTDTIILLHLPYLLNRLYNDFYKIDALDFEIEKQLNNLKHLIDTIIGSVVKNRSIFLCLFTPIEKRKPLAGQKNFDNVIEAFNKYIIEKYKYSKYIELIDTLSIYEHLGYNTYYCLAEQYIFDAVISRDAMQNIARIICSSYSTPKKKCIILDCDNVLWGGTIEEDGISGIKLSSHGFARTFFDFQREILKLKNQGYIICLCSKNKLINVKMVFDNHPDMLIKWCDITAYRISFDSKAINIVELANELNLDLDALVFIDDSPFEIQSVKSVLNIDTILLNPKEPHKYINLLYEDGYFNKNFISSDEKKRADWYKSTIAFSNYKDDPDKINKELDTQLSIYEATKICFDRVIELSRRTHRFNLSGIEYDLSSINEIVNKNGHIYCVSVCDKFGDLGIIGAAVVKISNQKAIIESFFLSCRVIGRKFEDSFLNFILNELNKYNITEIIGVYQFNGKNGDYRAFYNEHGITAINSYNC